MYLFIYLFMFYLKCKGMVYFLKLLKISQRAHVEWLENEDL